MVIRRKIPFHPYLHFWPHRVFFPFFCFLKFVHSSSPKPHKIEIKFFCKYVELQMQFCLLKFFEASPPEPPKNRALKTIFLTAQARVIVFCLYQ